MVKYQGSIKIEKIIILRINIVILKDTAFSKKNLEIELCLGNCCFLKGTNEILQELKRIIEENNLSDRVNLKPKTCLDQCENAPVMIINDVLITNVCLKDLDGIIKMYLFK